MTVRMASRVLQSATLSESGRQVLAFIKGGPQWLEWAIGTLHASYDFRDEVDLLMAVQSAIHGSPFILLPRLSLLVSPLKLMSVPAPDLRTLAHAEAGGDGAPRDAALNATLNANGLCTQRMLADGAAMLSTLGVGTAPAFQAMGLEDQLAIVALQQDLASSASLNKEAATFAAARAQSASEFVDYFRACISYWAASAATFADTESRAEAIAAAVDTLLPLTFAALDCPQVDGFVGAAELNTAIRNWLATGQSVGFTRSSLAMQQIIENGGYAGQKGAQAEKLLRDYIGSAQQALSVHNITKGRVEQNGQTWLFHTNSAAGQTDIELDRTGVISLRRFSRAGAQFVAALSDAAA
ncbi:hypothetical protein [Sphingomonas sp. R1]|uniref:hypothetical protein n=1 Tax=Sphingomonas sp. R1 TaxID=399176 RepID=UPI0022250E3F|nr:hypothetical protein [Sphingomonas sp. R1]UYY78423.1 hypothetical protein OIM94_05320 [Sphingomonas sp. R1]